VRKYKLELEDLTPEQYQYFIDNIFNGVGSRHFLFNPPDLIFNQAAKRHDFAYWRGGTEEDRKDADRRFKKDCLQEAKERSFLLRPFYTSIAYLYYYAIKVFKLFPSIKRFFSISECLVAKDFNGVIIKISNTCIKRA
jgi:hypothetical protein